MHIFDPSSSFKVNYGYTFWDVLRQKWNQYLTGISALNILTFFVIEVYFNFVATYYKVLWQHIVELPVRFVHEQVVTAELFLNPVLQLAIGGPGILVGTLVEGVAKFTGPLNDKK